MRLSYPAVIKYDPEGPDYEIRFPDFPNISAVDNNVVGALELMNEVLHEEIESIIEMDEELPEPTPFEPHLQQDSNCVSWWTIAHCDIGEADTENFDRIMSGLNEVADMVKTRPVSVIGLEMSPSNIDAMSGLMSGSDQ